MIVISSVVGDESSENGTESIRGSSIVDPVDVQPMISTVSNKEARIGEEEPARRQRMDKESLIPEAVTRVLTDLLVG